jgi:hypothetical protein
MSLDRSKLLHVHDLGNGRFIAQCPACAELGGDSQGQHLKVDSLGRFCCVINAGKDGELHRKRIFALAGIRSLPKPWSPQPFQAPISIPVSVLQALSLPFNSDNPY